MSPTSSGDDQRAHDAEPDVPREPTRFTVAANTVAAIFFDDPGDFDRATRGLVAQLDDGRVTSWPARTAGSSSIL